MKHLVGKIHHPHLKKRAIVETVGFIFLVTFSVLQWEIIEQALVSIRQSDILYLLLALCLYWVVLPLTSVSYKILSKKKIPLWSTTLSQLAGSGPGRIIPGGFGHLSVSVMHLKKLRIPVDRAIAISLANNLIGLTVNFSFLIILFLTDPEVKNLISSTVTLDKLLIIFFGVVVVVSIGMWLLHYKSIKSNLLVIKSELYNIIGNQLAHPTKLLKLISLALLILCGNVAMLLLCSSALDIIINPFDALIALSIGVFVGGLLPTPGGVGGVEAGVASTLILHGYDATSATSVALLFRTITYWQPLIPGTFAYLYLREKRML